MSAVIIEIKREAKPGCPYNELLILPSSG